MFIVNERKKNKITKVTKLLQKSRDKTNPFSMKPSDNIIITYGRPTLWWPLEWERRPTTKRPGSRPGLAVVARSDWLQGHAMETAKMRRERRRGRAESVEWRDA